MAFVNAGGLPLLHGAKAFVTGNALNAHTCDSRPAASAGGIRMLVEDGEFSSAKNNKWRENIFTGGIPGGEVFYRDWIANGMKDNIPDLPDKLQPTSEPQVKPKKSLGILGKLDRMEFLKGFVNATNFTEPQAKGPKSPLSSSDGSLLPGPAKVNPPERSTRGVQEFRAADPSTYSIPRQGTGSSPPESATSRSALKIGGKVINRSSTPSTRASDSTSQGARAPPSRTQMPRGQTSTQTEPKQPVDTSYPTFPSVPATPDYLEWARNPPPRYEGPVLVTPEMVQAAKEQAENEADPEAPNEALYAPYFPRETRNLAPEIKMQYNNDPKTDFISMAMTRVTAKASDRFFPKERAGKAPVIKIFYTGSLSTASVSVAMEDIEPFPGFTPPAPKGEATASLVEGSGGGLKLDFTVDGESISPY